MLGLPGDQDLLGGDSQTYIWPKCETMYLGELLFETWNIKKTNKKKLLAILLAASKKSVTRKWLKVEPPTTDEWIDVYEIMRFYFLSELNEKNSTGPRPNWLYLCCV